MSATRYPSRERLLHASTPLRLGILLSLVLFFLLVPGWAAAQGDLPDGPIYIVQPGDTLFIIAAQFGVTVDDLIAVNQITSPNQLSVGDQLVIPGLPGIRGVLTTEAVSYGETLTSVGRRYRVPIDTLGRLNRIVSPVELYAGSSVILPRQEAEVQGVGRTYLQPGMSLLELSVRENTNPWGLLLRNQLQASYEALPGDVLLYDGAADSGPGALPPQIAGVEIRKFPLLQGDTSEMILQTSSDLAVEGQLQMADLRNQAEILSEFRLFPASDGRFIGLFGVHAMAEIGLFPLVLNGEFPDGQRFSYTQLVPVAEGGYGFDLPLQVDPKTLDPEVTRPEDLLWSSVTVETTPDRYWDGLFSSPSPFGDCWTSRYGSRRSYNGSAYNYFHTGLDFCGGVGIEIRAPAPGRVVFAGPLVVRGNATMIDHGWGVYTGYMHQSELLVEVGDWVEAGQLIGLVGGTGRVTGAHLHWEVWVGGIQVDPVEWLEQIFP